VLLLVGLQILMQLDLVIRELEDLPEVIFIREAWVDELMRHCLQQLHRIWIVEVISRLSRQDDEPRILSDLARNFFDNS